MSRFVHVASDVFIYATIFANHSTKVEKIHNFFDVFSSRADGVLLLVFNLRNAEMKPRIVLLLLNAHGRGPDHEVL